jgi:hypothetical protein
LLIVEKGILRTVAPETATADDMDVEVGDNTIESFWAASGPVSALFQVRVVSVPPSGHALSTYAALVVGGTAHGPVAVEKPQGTEPFCVRIGDKLSIRVTYGAAR